MTNPHKDITLADYLWTRIHQLGVRSVHGVPGDYNLNLIDNISATGLKWVGSCNELNGGYATDGYARVKGVGALLTTGGVGELSAINAHAGAFSERISLIHVVGSQPLRLRSNSRFCMHHSLGNHEFSVFKDMFRTISVVQVTLDNPSTAAEDIDRALTACWVSSRPVYIDVPSDMGRVQLDGSRLEKALDLSYPHNDEKTEELVFSKLRQRLGTARRPCILIDLLATRQRIRDELHQLIVKSKLPVFVTPLAQGYVNESLPNFRGLYAGKGSHAGVQAFVEESDLVLHIGPLDTDVTTYLGTANISKATLVRFWEDEVDIAGDVHTSVHLRTILLRLLDNFDFSAFSFDSHSLPQANGILSKIEVDSAISQDWLWNYLSSWLKAGDIVLTDTGTASFGIFDTKLPQNNILISISLWASIGHSLPAAQGAALAAKDDREERRTILFQGDGSFQLTCQEISTMIRHRLDVIIFVICNNGYTIERAVHDTKEDYNDIADWNYKEILRVFDRNAQFSQSHEVRTKGELQRLLQNSDFLSYRGVQLVELHIPELDVPGPLRKLADLINNRK